MKRFTTNPNLRFHKIRDSGGISNPNLISKISNPNLKKINLGRISNIESETRFLPIFRGAES